MFPVAMLDKLLLFRPAECVAVDPTAGELRQRVQSAERAMPIGLLARAPADAQSVDGSRFAAVLPTVPCDAGRGLLR